jgi:hypothetical protein
MQTTAECNQTESFQLDDPLISSREVELKLFCARNRQGSITSRKKSGSTTELV